MEPYDDEFYIKLNEGSRRSARVVVPMVMEILHPTSVIDVGCGSGTWLAVFRENGVQDIQGADGDYVNRLLLEIPKDRFLSADLKEPFRLDRRFDLACSLEVAEHLPPDCAQIFVDSLASLAPAVLFSAAVPHQGGVGHINEQWQDYWARLFEDRGYVTVDCLRRKIWTDARVEYWYAQNTLLYVRHEILAANPDLAYERELVGAPMLPLVHPKRYLEWVEWGVNQANYTSAACKHNSQQA